MKKKPNKKPAVPGVKRIAFIPDSHHPNVDRLAWTLLLKALRHFEPDILVIGGDFADCAPLSMHAPHHTKQEYLLDEMYEVNAALNQLDQLGARKKIYIEGNHENRLTRYICKQAQALDGLLSIPRMLHLQERGWSWVPYGTTYQLGKMHITHDIGQAGMNAHRTAASAHMGSTIINHTHRMAYEVRGTFGGLPYLAAMFGWLGDRKTAATYMHEAKTRSEWALGFGLGHMIEETGVVFVQPVPIVDYRCLVGTDIISL